MVYGKIFESLFTGSMFGCGAVKFAVWGYVIAHTKPSQSESGEETGIVEINPPVLAAALGESVEAVQEAIDFLSQPDPASRNPAHEGRRLLHVGSFLYEVPSFPIYQRKQNSDERKAAVRDRVRAHRERKKRDGNAMVTLGNASNATQTQYSDVPNSTQSTPLTPQGGNRRREKPDDTSSKPRSKPCPRPDDVDEATWESWLALRRAKRAPVSTIAVEGLRREARKANLDLRAVMAICCQNGWQGFHSDWLARSKTRGDAWADRFQKPPPGSALDKWMNSTEDVLGPYGQTEEQP